ncbi:MULTISPECIES: GntR family transcriptional regulator [Rhodococcus]|uniref:GntR family transcriptional regulator n=1 Tax=Rhodococcus globerulus TaxID=33008 RepID=UPI001C59E113|nr:GntR family transcriptional regulator [Rhodococcus globerulus]QXW04975.1 GntR family transcriptional regulator [Rhodococcus globerulus]
MTSGTNAVPLSDTNLLTGAPGGLLDTPLPKQIYSIIRERIIAGTYPPGSRLRERELAEEFRVSRVPLREALPQLESDGFIQILPRRGAVVTQLSLVDINELFDLRLALEPYASRCAAENVAAGASTAALDATMRRTEELMGTDEPLLIPAINAQFHMDIVKLSQNRLLESVMTSLMGRVHWLFRLTWHHNPVASCTAHRELCEAIRSGNGRLAEATAFAHIEHGREPTMNSLRHIQPDV